MYIKSLTLSNFRSFKSKEASIDDFSSGVNAVIGRNGSGKSNLFDAIQFVLLAPRFANLRQEEKQAILHEGSGAQAMNAYVEVVFDNSDHRFSFENSDEVVLRRTIGLKKDEFFLQRKRVTKQEVQALLEGAGISKSNPYFLVQQGKIQDITNMSDGERLRLLKEVAGTTVYDQKKAESQAKMTENDQSLQEVEGLLQEIQDKLEELQTEKEELTQYQALDRERRMLEYQIYSKELRKARTMLDTIEAEKHDHVERTADIHDACKALHSKMEHLQDSIKAKQNVLRRKRLAAESVQQDQSTLSNKVTQLSLTCRELEETVHLGEQTLKANAKELKRLEVEIQQAQTDLNEVQPVYAAKLAEQQARQDERAQTERRIQALYEKQGRHKQFATRAARDAHLRVLVDENRTLLQEKAAALSETQDALASLRRSHDKDQQEMTKARESVQSSAAALRGMEKALDQKTKDRVALADRRKDEWRQTELLADQVREARQDYHQSLSDTRKVMPKATAHGMEALETIVTEEGLQDQYLGTVLDNMTLRNPKFQTAVEVAAQNSLFHVIVDTDVTASRLMKRLEDDKLGRVTFLPLNQLRVETVHCPEAEGVCRLLETCVEYDAKVARAMQHVFNKKYLARSDELASEWSTKYGVDAITLEGDLCTRKGALSGGYVDAGKSRLRAFSNMKKAEQKYHQLDEQYQERKRQADSIDQQATNLAQEIQRLQKKHGELVRIVENKEKSVEQLGERVTAQKKNAEDIETNQIPLFERDIAAMTQDIENLEQEMSTDMVETLSDDDRALLDSLKQKFKDLNEQLDAQADELTNLAVDRQKLTSLLEDNLLKRRKELTEGVVEEGDDMPISRRISRGDKSSEALIAERKDELEERQRELEVAKRAKEDIEARLKEALAEEEQMTNDISDAKDTLDKFREEDMELGKQLEESEGKFEKLMSKRSIFISKRDEYQRKIEKLGALSNQSDKYANKSINDVMKLLEGVNRKLKKYTHINKKAFDQYVSFNEQREGLLKRKEELDAGAEDVKKCIDHLDQQKDEAINRTFRGVSQHFKDVFKELVPNGEGELVMRSALDEIEEGTDGESSDDDGSPKKQKAFDPSNPDVSLYRGIGVNVRFSEVGENYMMSQLSGGQKALVALALIFAIQRCDPAPFYVFDELDQALDSTYRASVANLVKNQASDKETPTQFILSTFRPELVQVSNKSYGIMLQNKVSGVEKISKRDALGFIAEMLNEEEAVGDVSTVASSSTRRSRKRKSRDEGSVATGSIATADDATVETEQ